eukprot:m.31544 g.31544  ORF g.31544 m.31544 type:complete len:211 (-) comp10694_c0_seq1:109-741(-)
MLFHVLHKLNAKTIILASGSPRRQELLSMLRLNFTVNVSHFDEKSLNKSDFETPNQYVEFNSFKKAEEVAQRLGNEFDIIIGSDTVVVQDEHILEKPESEEAAVEMIKKLSGKMHKVVTGVTLIYHRGGGLLEHDSFHVETKVRFAMLSEAEIRAYVATGDSLDKAGAYGIQSCGSALIEGIEGDYFTVVGLPVHLLCKHLARWSETFDA